MVNLYNLFILYVFIFIIGLIITFIGYNLSNLSKNDKKIFEYTGFSIIFISMFLVVITLISKKFKIN